MKKLFILFVLLSFTALYAQSNISEIVQENNDNTVTLDQVGSSNINKLIQQVKNNTAIIEQTGASNILKNSKLWTGDGDFAKQRAASYLKLEQLGDYNTLGLFQNNQKNAADVYQEGLQNSADVWQRAFGGAVSGNETDIDQVGNNNTAEAYQKGDLNFSRLLQDGNLNTTILKQDGINIGPDGGLSNTATLLVTGNENMVDAYQYGNNNTGNVTVDYYGDGHTVAEFNNVDLDQSGNGNQSNNLIKGASNDVKVSQSGVGQHREYLQIFGSSNDVDIISVGQNNRGFWLLNGGADDNRLYVEKDGTNNKATGHIMGDLNDVNVYQSGEANSVGTDYNAKDGVIITGNSNMVDIDQTGIGFNSSFNTITGNGNSISVNQGN